MNIPGYRDLIRLAIPVILANAAVPLLGLADTAVIGRTGDAAALGAIALGALIFSFLYWGFGFLRMGTTGFTAQAAGAGDWPEVRAAFARALLLGLGIGVTLILFQWPLGLAALALLNGSESVEQGVQQYFHVRIWGAPATLGLFALLGTLIGLGHTRQLLWLQLFLNGLNVLLDVLFVAGFGWGVRGIALGTVIAEWTSLLLGLWMVVRLIRPLDDAPLWPWQRILVREHWLRTLRANADIMWRTLMLLFGFAWFTDQGARFGDVTLAANHILLQFISLSAFFLDGYAFVVESQVGRAMGARQALWFRQVIERSTILAALTAVGLALLVWLPGPLFIDALTTVDAVREAARVPAVGGAVCAVFVCRVPARRDLYRHHREPAHAQRHRTGAAGVSARGLGTGAAVCQPRAVAGVRAVRDRARHHAGRVSADIASPHQGGGMKFIFEVHIRDGCTAEQYADAWVRASELIQQAPGARGTTLHRKIGDPRTLIAIAYWDSKAQRDAMEAVPNPAVDAIIRDAAQYCDIRLIGEFEEPEWVVTPAPPATP